MERYVVNKGRYSEIYVKTGNTEGLIEYLEKIVLTDGYLLWEVGTSYAKSLRPTMYYVSAKSSREAMRIFKKKFSWLDCIASVGLPDSTTAEYVLNNPMKRVII